MNREDFGWTRRGEMVKLAIGRFVYYFGFCDFRFVAKFHERLANGKIGKILVDKSKIILKCLQIGFTGDSVIRSFDHCQITLADVDLYRRSNPPDSTLQTRNKENLKRNRVNAFFAQLLPFVSRVLITDFRVIDSNCKERKGEAIDG